MPKANKILLVDDDRIIQMVHKSMLLKINPRFDLQLCFDGTEVISFLQSQIPHTHRYLILLDINMPKMGAWALLTELEQHFSDFEYKVIIITSSIDIDDQERAEKSPKVIKFLIKPVAISTFDNLFANELNV